MNRVMHGIPIGVTIERFTGEKAQFSTAVRDYLQSQKESLMKDLRIEL